MRARFEKTPSFPAPPDVDNLHDEDADIDFEDLIGEMVTTFVRIRAERIDEEIDRWVERVGLAVDLDRVNVAEYDGATSLMRVSHCWTRDGIPPVPKGIDTASCLPQLTAMALSGETVVFSSREELPRSLIPEANNTDFVQGVKANVTVPLKVGGAIIGGVAFGSLRRERKWSPRMLRRLQLVAEVFGGALERKRDIEKIRRLYNELSEISNNSRMGELTGSLAHELDQPLGAILNNAEAAISILSAESPDIHEAKEALEDIVRDDRRAADIIQHVRNLLRRGEVHPSLMDPAEVLLDVEKILKHDAVMRNIDFSVDFARPLPMISGYKTQLTQALVNLVLNAFDAVTEVDEQPRLVSVSATQGIGTLCVAVRDSGEGIGPRIVEHLFRPFFTTKQHGMGLGLAIVRSIVESHGGEITARRNPDRGTTFEVKLPSGCAA